MKINRVIYIIRNNINGKRYVGLSKYGTAHRWRGHVKEAREGSQYHLKNAIRKYGVDSFTIRVLERCASDQELKRREVFWIAKLGTHTKGYNHTLGGDGSNGLKWRPKSRRNGRLAQQRNHANPNWRKAVSDGVRAAWKRPEVKRRMKAAITRVYKDEHFRKRLAATIRKLTRTSTWKKAQKAGVQQRSKNPKWRAAVAIANRIKARNPQCRAAHKAAFARPEVRKRKAAATRAMFKRPGVKRNHAVGMRAMWKRPSVRRNHAVGQTKRNRREFTERCVALYKRGFPLTQISRDWCNGKEPNLNKIRAALIRAGVWRKR